MGKVNPDIYGLYQMCETYRSQVESLQKENESLRKQLTWIPVAERLPTKDDANEKGEVLCRNKVFVQIVQWDFQYLKSHMTHWLPIPSINNK